MLGRPVQHSQLLHAAILQMPHHLLTGSARPNDERAMIVQPAEDALREPHPRKRHGDGPRANVRLRAHALADFECALKQTIQHRSRSALLVREPVSFAHLAKNFGFAEHHGVEARGDKEQMPYRLAVIVVV